MTASLPLLGVFAKWPQAGQVKTRLAAASSPQWAAEVARAFLLDLLDRLSGVEARRGLPVARAQSPADFARLTGDRFALTRQQEGDLGRRMQAFFEEQL